MAAEATGADDSAYPSPGRLGLAFGLVLAAGASTALGAALAFCTKTSNTGLLAAALGLSAGVMIYVSIVEIFATKSVEGFTSAGFSHSEAYRYATLTFFGGIVFMGLLDKAVDFMTSCAQGRKPGKDRSPADYKGEPSSEGAPEDTPAATTLLNGTVCGGSPPLDAAVYDTADIEAACTASGEAKQGCPCDQRAYGKQRQQQPDEEYGLRHSVSAPSKLHAAQQAQHASADGCSSHPNSSSGAAVSSGPSDSYISATDGQKQHAQKARAPAEAHVMHGHHHGLIRLGLLSALAIGIHNFPEGLATFVGTLAQPSAGVAIAVAIALHNIPEGIVVAMPIYYATGSKWRGFLMSAVAGFAEPVGALLGYAILRGSGDLAPLAYGLLFAGVAGMMVYISVHELLPTALKYDAEDRWTTRCALLGMAIMAASLLLFEL